MNLGDIKHPDPRVQLACRRYAAGIMRDPRIRRRDGNVEEQVRRFMESSERYHLTVRWIGEILNESGIPLSSSLPYRNFAGRVIKVMEKFELLTRHMQILEALNRAVAYGCNPAVLYRICREVLKYDIDEKAAELKFP